MRRANIFAMSIAALALTASTSVLAALSDSVMELAKKCVPNVSPVTVASIVAHESGNHQYAINVNGSYRLPRQPAGQDEAVATAQWLAAHGMNYDVGYGQINSANFARLGLVGKDLFDPCVNLRASAAVLSWCYSKAVGNFGQGQNALLHALSCYNTGSQTRGFSNGYVTKVVAQVRVLQIPALMDASGGVESKAQPVDDSVISNVKAIGKLPKKAPVINETEKSDQGAFAQDDPGAFGLAQPESP